MSSDGYHTIRIDVNSAGVCTLLLNRPEVHNAFDEMMIEEITNALQQLQADDTIRVLCVKGAGTSFCAGADLNWMKRSADRAADENYRDALRMADMMYALYSFSRPTLGVVHGSIFGGGVGLVACCDVVIAESASIFSLSEVKLGLIPAVIGPYVVNAMGPRTGRRYILTGERFDAAAAHRSNLIHETIHKDELPAAEARMLRELLAAAPQAQKAAKGLIAGALSPAMDGDIRTHTAELIAEIRASDEGREGVGAFLAKRRPNWRHS